VLSTRTVFIVNICVQFFVTKHRIVPCTVLLVSDFPRPSLLLLSLYLCIFSYFSCPNFMFMFTEQGRRDFLWNSPSTHHNAMTYDALNLLYGGDTTQTELLYGGDTTQTELPKPLDHNTHSVFL
jgi:hypothetical protein